MAAKALSQLCVLATTRLDGTKTDISRHMATGIVTVAVVTLAIGAATARLDAQVKTSNADGLKVAGQSAAVRQDARGVVTTADQTSLVGPMGPEGPMGPTGPTGPTGATGATGPAGADGADGERGATGPAGPAGAQGAQGPQGPIGLQGFQGATG